MRGRKTDYIVFSIIFTAIYTGVGITDLSSIATAKNAIIRIVEFIYCIILWTFAMGNITNFIFRRRRK